MELTITEIKNLIIRNINKWDGGSSLIPQNMVLETKTNISLAHTRNKDILLDCG